MKEVIIAVSILAVAATLGFTVMSMTPVDAAFKVQKLNDFFLTNQTTGQPILAIVGQAINNGSETEDQLDISLTMFDRNNSIVGIGLQYDDDVKPNDTLPFEFLVDPSTIEFGDFNNVENYTVIAE